MSVWVAADADCAIVELLLGSLSGRWHLQAVHFDDYGTRHKPGVVSGTEYIVAAATAHCWGASTNAGAAAVVGGI